MIQELKQLWEKFWEDWEASFLDWVIVGLMIFGIYLFVGLILFSFEGFMDFISKK